MPIRKTDEVGVYFICGRCGDEFYSQNGMYCGICNVLLREMRLYNILGKGIKFASPDGEMVEKKAVIAGRFMEIDIGEVEGDRFFRV